VTERWIWAFGVLITAIVLGVLAVKRHRSSNDEIMVRLVDRETGAALTNIFVTIMETVEVPVIGSIPWIPQEWRYKTASRVRQAVDGTFRVRRISESSKVHKGFVFSTRDSFIGGCACTPEEFGEKPVAPTGQVTIKLHMLHPKK